MEPKSENEKACKGLTRAMNDTLEELRSHFQRFTARAVKEINAEENKFEGVVCAEEQVAQLRDQSRRVLSLKIYLETAEKCLQIIAYLHSLSSELSISTADEAVNIFLKIEETFWLLHGLASNFRISKLEKLNTLIIYFGRIGKPIAARNKTELPVPTADDIDRHMARLKEKNLLIERCSPSTATSPNELVRDPAKIRFTRQDLFFSENLSDPLRGARIQEIHNFISLLDKLHTLGV